MEKRKFKVALRNPETEFVMFFDSSFEREIGDKMEVNGKKYLVIAKLENQAQEIEFVTRHNAAVKMQNAINRRKNRQIEMDFWAKIYNSNPIIRDCIDTIAYCRQHNIQ